MKRPTKQKITEFLNEKYPHIIFDGIEFEETSPDRCWFKIISYGRLIGQADYFLDEKFWANVENHLNWTFG
jgi:hypothetical protein